jgi:hypothetical protein
MKPNKDTQAAIIARLPLSQAIHPQCRNQAATLARSMRSGFALMRERSKGARFASLFPAKVRAQAIRTTLRARFGWNGKQVPAKAAPAPCDYCAEHAPSARALTVRGLHTPARLVRVCSPCDALQAA